MPGISTCSRSSQPPARRVSVATMSRRARPGRRVSRSRSAGQSPAGSATRSVTVITTRCSGRAGTVLSNRSRSSVLVERAASGGEPLRSRERPRRGTVSAPASARRRDRPRLRVPRSGTPRSAPRCGAGGAARRRAPASRPRGPGRTANGGSTPLRRASRAARASSTSRSKPFRRAGERGEPAGEFVEQIATRADERQAQRECAIRPTRAVRACAAIRRRRRAWARRRRRRGRRRAALRRRCRRWRAGNLRDRPRGAGRSRRGVVTAAQAP